MQTDVKIINGKDGAKWPGTEQKKVVEWEDAENNIASGHVNEGQ